MTTIASINGSEAPNRVDGRIADNTGTASAEATRAFQQKLSEQLAGNARLAADLRSAMVSVGEALTQIGDATGQAATQTALKSLPEQVSDNAVLGAELEAARAGVDETLEKVGARLQDEETAEVSADALVAAGVTTAATVQTASAAASRETTVVVPVDVVRMQAAEAVSADVLVQAADAVADTLLVTPGLLKGQGDVIVQLRPDVLEGTEVRISVTGRQLEVVFQPQTVDMAVLIENARTVLVQHLASKIVSFNVSVDVRKKREIA